MRQLLLLSVLCALVALIVVPTGSAGRPPGFNCQPDGLVCQFSFPDQPYGPVDSGPTCGSGASAFDIFDRGVESDSGTAWLDSNGDALKIIDHFVVTDAMWSNPLTGDVVPYTQNTTVTTAFVVPGDFSTGIQTVTGENIYRTATGTGKWVLHSTGRQITDTDFNLIWTTPDNPFYSNDPHAFDAVCTALGA